MLKSMTDAIIGSASSAEVNLFMSLYTMAHLSAYEFVCTNLSVNKDHKESPLHTMIFYEFRLLDRMKNEIESNPKLYGKVISSAFDTYLLKIWEKSPVRGFQ